MRYLVTGGTGFVGVYVVRDLLAAGHEVAVLDLVPDRELLADVLGGSVPESLAVMSGDVADLPAMLRAMREARPDRVVHLAATLGRSSEANPLRMLRVNCEGTINVFESALALGVPKVVWASSIAVFGSLRDGRQIANDAPHAPTGLYGAAKSMNERLGAHYRQARGLDSVGLRLTGVYGHGKATTLARGSAATKHVELLEKPARGERGVLTNGNDTADWLYVEDAARAFRLASDAPPCSQPGLTICGDMRPISEAVAYVRRVLPEAEIDVATDRPGTVDSYDPVAADVAIGYRRRYSMEDGFRKTINDVRARYGLPAV